MNRISIIIIVFFIFYSCNKKTIVNNYDEINYYKIDNKTAYKYDSIKRFNEIFMGVYGHKIDIDNFENELLKFGYKKNEVEKEKIIKIDSFISNNIFYDSHLSACVPFYHDILILKKKRKTIGILKVCFDCAMIDKYGEIKTSFKDSYINDEYFSNFNNLYFILNNKEYTREAYFNPRDTIK